MQIIHDTLQNPGLQLPTVRNFRSYSITEEVKLFVSQTNGPYIAAPHNHRSSRRAWLCAQTSEASSTTGPQRVPLLSDLVW